MRSSKFQSSMCSSRINNSINTKPKNSEYKTIKRLCSKKKRLIKSNKLFEISALALS